MANLKIPEVWVSPEGDNKAAGTKASPVKSLQTAIRLMRQKRRNADQTTGGRILLRGGTHELARPVVLDRRDTPVTLKPFGLESRDDPLVPLEICSAPGEQAVLSGGRRISGWRETELNGARAWTVSLPRVKKGTWSFTQLWVNGKRASRPRLPRTGTFRIERRMRTTTTSGLQDQDKIFTPENQFVYAEGDMRAFRNLNDVDFVALHYWVESRIPLASVDEDKRLVTLAHSTQMQLTDNNTKAPAPYFLDNVAEALSEPGEWYLDRPSGMLTYLPLPSEKIENTIVVAPVLDHLVRLEGNVENDAHVQHIRLRDLMFAHTEPTPEEIASGRKATPQAACYASGTVRLVHAQHCFIENCTVENVGGYGIEISGDSTECEVRHCRISDLGAGGIKIFHTNRDGSPAVSKERGPWHHPRRIVVADCEIHHGGQRMRQAVGILVGNCSGIQVLHNHIHHFYYTGVSVGWTWGYHESFSYGNIVEWNHIHDIGQGELSDMGGIYILGPQPGTRLRYNHIHDVESRGYGGWGIYPDEGSSELLIEFNLVHDTKFESFCQHCGKNNIVRNNIFAFGREGGMARLGRAQSHNAFDFERNIVVRDGAGLMVKPPYNHPGIPLPCRFDNNIYFHLEAKRLDFIGQSWTEWRKAGQDKHSVSCDPGFADLENRDFRLRPDSPASRIGFIPFDLSAAGPRRR